MSTAQNASPSLSERPTSPFADLTPRDWAAVACSALVLLLSFFPWARLTVDMFGMSQSHDAGAAISETPLSVVLAWLGSAAVLAVILFGARVPSQRAVRLGGAALVLLAVLVAGSVGGSSLVPGDEVFGTAMADDLDEMMDVGVTGAWMLSLLASIGALGLALVHRPSASR